MRNSKWGWISKHWHLLWWHLLWCHRIRRPESSSVTNRHHGIAAWASGMGNLTHELSWFCSRWILHLFLHVVILDLKVTDVDIRRMSNRLERLHDLSSGRGANPFLLGTAPEYLIDNPFDRGSFPFLLRRLWYLLLRVTNESGSGVDRLALDGLEVLELLTSNNILAQYILLSLASISCRRLSTPGCSLFLWLDLLASSVGFSWRGRQLSFVVLTFKRSLKVLNGHRATICKKWSNLDTAWIFTIFFCFLSLRWLSCRWLILQNVIQIVDNISHWVLV